MRVAKILPVCLAVLLLAAMLTVRSVLTNYTWTLRANWDITLPQNACAVLVYQASSGMSFHGDGVRYHVFLCMQTNTLNHAAAWQPVPDEGLPEVEGWLDQIEVSDSLRPKVSSCIYEYRTRQDRSSMAILWDRESGLLYVAEHFI